MIQLRHDLYGTTKRQLTSFGLCGSSHSCPDVPVPPLNYDVGSQNLFWLAQGADEVIPVEHTRDFQLLKAAAYLPFLSWPNELWPPMVWCWDLTWNPAADGFSPLKPFTISDCRWWRLRVKLCSIFSHDSVRWKLQAKCLYEKSWCILYTV